MEKALIAIKRGFGGLLDFKGRSSRTDFWFYAIFVALIAIGIWVTVMSLEMSRTFAEANEFAAQNPDKVSITASSSNYSITIKDNQAGIAPNFGNLFLWIAGIAVAMIALLAAAAVRRLHDTNRTGLWAALPVPFLLSGFWLMSRVFSSFNNPTAPDMSWFFLGFVNNLIYLAAIGFLAFLLLRSGKMDENRFGSRTSGQSL